MAVRSFQETRIQAHIGPFHLRDAIGNLALGQRWQTAIPLRPFSVGLYSGTVVSHRNGEQATVYDHELSESYINEHALETLVADPRAIKLAYTPAEDAVLSVETTPLSSGSGKVHRKIIISSGILAIKGRLVMDEDVNGLVDMVAQGKKFITPLIVDEEAGYWPDHRIPVDFVIREQTSDQPVLSVVTASQ